MQTATTARGRFATSEAVGIVSSRSGDQFDIQWMPPGRQSITAFVGEEPTKMEFTVTARHAEQLNAQLQRLRTVAATGQSDEPFIDFNHEDGAAAGHATEIYWAGGDPQRGGIRLKGKWTGSGKAAVQNRDFTRFSPQWDFDPNTYEPTGIGVNLGGLVNRAAFRAIQTVVAKSANSKSPERVKLDEAVERLTQGIEKLVNHSKWQEGVNRAHARGGVTSTATGRHEHEFITTAKAIATRDSLTMAQAQARLAQTNYGLYKQYLCSCTADASKQRVIARRPAGAAQFARRVQEIQAQGKGLVEAANIAAARHPDLAAAYRQGTVFVHTAQAAAEAITSDDVQNMTLAGIEDHPFRQLVDQGVADHGLVPMEAARIAAQKYPHLYDEWCQAYEVAGRKEPYFRGRGPDMVSDEK